MPQSYYLAIDIGASSGRHILGWIENGKIRIEEIHRFQNGLVGRNGHLCWDVDHLFHEVVEGLKRCRTLNRIPKSVGIDTWGVDFVLLDEAGQLLGDTVAYRDGRTQGMDALVYRTISEQALYARNGIQKQIFNSIYQLMAIQQESPENLSAAKHFLMIPDYLNYLLTGVMKNEYTNATTTQLVSAETQDWDDELMDMLGLPKEMFGAIAMPKTPVGALTEKIAAEVGFQTEVVLPATHDTGSAVMAVPSTSDDSIYLSSGTWSLMGIEHLIPDCSEVSQQHNFTNEGGYHYRYRYLKNIMGMWMMQNLRKEFRHDYTFEELYQLAHIGRYFTSTVDVNDAAFLAPQSIRAALQEYCERTGQEAPETEAFTRELWEMATEDPVIFPEGIGVVPWMVPGGKEIADASVKLMEKYRVVVWAHHGLFVCGDDFDEAFGLMDTVEKAATICVKVLSMGGKKQTIPREGFVQLAKDFHIALNMDLLD